MAGSVGKGAAANSPPPGLAVFMAALRWTESGSPGGNYSEGNGQGAYQIIQSNWPAWAAQYAGYHTSNPNASDAPKSVQDQVAAGKLAEYYYGAGQRNWRLVARIWNGGSPNPVPNPALGTGATTDDYADIVLGHAAYLATQPGYDPGNVNWLAIGAAPSAPYVAPGKPGTKTGGAGGCHHDLKIALPAAPDIHLCMDKPIAVMAITAGGTIALIGIGILLAVTLKDTGAGKAAGTALAVLPAGRVAKAAKAAAPAARAERARTAEQTRQAAEARRTAPVRAEERRSAAAASEERRRAAKARSEARIRNAKARNDERRRDEAHQLRQVHAVRRSRAAADRSTSGRGFDGPNAGRSSASIRAQNKARRAPQPAPF